MLPNTSKQLYKYLLKEIKKLPKDAQGYYKYYVKQQYNSHSDEDDPIRIQQIINQAIRDAHWVVYVKYGIKDI